MAKWRWLEQITDHEQLVRLKVIENVPLFAGLSRRQLGKLLVKFFEKEYRPGETIFTEGEPGKALFIVLTGSVLICRALHEGEENLATLGAGSYFGELALIDDQPRFASARATEASLLLILYRSDFEDLMEGHRTLAIQVMANLLKTLAGYVRRAQSQRNGRNSVSAALTSTADKPGMPSETVSRD
jgi:CRP/FNR family transcriptional regulator, cyclic AMP receptor protein